MRRRTLLATVSGVLGSGAAGCLAAPGRGAVGGTPSTEGTPAGTWTQVAHDARNSRHAPTARGPRDDAAVAWTVLGDRPVYPPVVHDALYLTEAWTGGAALSLAPAEGTERWSNRDLPPIRWAPALDGNRLLVLTRTEGNVVRLHALDTATGDAAWVRESGVTASIGGTPPMGPTVRDGTVYVGSNRGIVACDAATGAVDWTATLGPHVVDAADGPTWRTDWATPAVTADRAFTFDTNRSYGATRAVRAVDRTSGERAWTAELSVGDGWSLAGHVVAGDDRVFVAAHKPALSAGTEGMAAGTGGGSTGTGGTTATEGSPTGSEGSPTGSRDVGRERLFALAADDGAVAWERDIPVPTVGPPAYADGTLYVGEWRPDGGGGRLRALDAADGHPLWTNRTDAGPVQSPTVAGDTVYVAQGGTLAAVSRANGTRRWRLEVGERLGPPVVAGDTAYVVTNPGRDADSRLVAVREP